MQLPELQLRHRCCRVSSGSPSLPGSASQEQQQQFPAALGLPWEWLSFKTAPLGDASARVGRDQGKGQLEPPGLQLGCGCPGQRAQQSRNPQQNSIDTLCHSPAKMSGSEQVFSWEKHRKLGREALECNNPGCPCCSCPLHSPHSLGFRLEFSMRKAEFTVLCVPTGGAALGGDSAVAPPAWGPSVPVPPSWGHLSTPGTAPELPHLQQVRISHSNWHFPGCF